MSEQEQKRLNAIFIGTWPIADAHDPALDETGIPEGAAIFGLIDDNYKKYAAPERIPGLTQVGNIVTLKRENKPGTWCSVRVSSGYNYVIVLTDKPENLTVEMKEVSYPHMGKMGGLRIINLPKFSALSSGPLPFDKLFGEFDMWRQKIYAKLARDTFYAHPDFLWNEPGGNATWIWAVGDDVTAEDCEPYELIKFPGGMYAVATADQNDQTELSFVVDEMISWIENSGVFENDSGNGRYGMGHMTGIGLTDVLGWAQQEIFWPIKYKENI